MKCNGCGFSMTASEVPAGGGCNACGGGFSFESDDLLLRQHGAPGRDVRLGQVEMGRLVEKVIQENTIAIIEAPVGSGKSDAYGAPAMISAIPGKQLKLDTLGPNIPASLKKLAAPFRRIIIATAKKNLQHQIAEKDLPFLRARLGVKDLKIALLKGKNNYACLLKTRSLRPEDAKQFTAWYENSEVGDLWDYPGPYNVKMNITADDCIGRDCASAKSGDCGYWRTRVEAHAARLVVTNHHVVAFDLRFGPGTVLGPYTTLILDEAHQAPASFRAAFSRTITQTGHVHLVRLLDRAGLSKKHETKLRAAWDAMFAKVIFREGEIPADPFGDEGTATATCLLEIFEDVSTQTKNLGYSEARTPDSVGPVNPFANVKESNREEVGELLTVRKFIQRTLEILRDTRTPDTNTVLFVGMNEKNQIKVTLSPISLGPIVGPKLQQIPSVVVTSATIATAKRWVDSFGKTRAEYDFNDIKQQLGMNWAQYDDADGVSRPSKKVHELVLETPFNYALQAILYAPRHMPLPPSGNEVSDRTRYVSALAAECSRLIRASNGNAFVLFTAKKDLLEVHAALVEDDLPQPLILQGEDAAASFKQFMVTPNSVLLGVKSFWEGVDVQGQKLQLVIITKLPFPFPNDPVLKARERVVVSGQIAQGVQLVTAQMSCFPMLHIPHMLTEIRQGAGRLIRSKTDRGVLAILDPRILSGSAKKPPTPGQKTFNGYGKMVVDAIGFTNYCFEYEQIKLVLEQWNEREAARAATKKSSSTSGEAVPAAGAPTSDAR